ncbi:MAG: L-serine ammonia-lyase, iron-sulfur-dependent, subunit alpha [Candidatus Muiribacteriota bacterium]
MNFREFYNKNIKLAYGCTEPVAVAFAVAHAARLLGDKPIRKLVVITDRNIFKNGFGAGIPGSDGKTGNLYAASLGLFIKEPEKGFEIFSNVARDIHEKADKFLNEKRVSLLVDKEKKGIFILAKVYTYDDDYAVAEIKHEHLGLVKLILNGEIKFEAPTYEENKNNGYNSVSYFGAATVANIIDYASTISDEDLELTENVINANIKASQSGLTIPIGLGLGYSVKKLWDEGKICQCVENYIKYMVAGACDARMGGEKVGVMTLCSSGNQGIAASLPVYCFYEYNKLDDRKKLQIALAVSFMVTAYIKEKLGKLSPVCGCVSASASGATAGIAFLSGASTAEIIDSVSNLLADITGVICDGAKGSCSLKLSTACGNSVSYALLAMNRCVVDEHNGIIEERIENTIDNLRKIAQAGMSTVDDEIVKIFENKLKKGKG